VYCDARDLVLLNDDIINATGISSDESNRPLALDFGQAVLTNQPGLPTVTLWA
jgi:hypothetical protein